MKKFIAILLIAIMCFSFVACNNNADKNTENAPENTTEVNNNKTPDEAEKDVLGTWKSKDGKSYSVLTFNNDNTISVYECVYADVGDEYHEKKDSYRWEYNAEKGCYEFISSTGDVVSSLFMKADDKDNYLLNNDVKFYRQNDK